MTADYDRTMGWTVVLLVIIAAGIAFDYLRDWYHSRRLRMDNKIPDYHSNHVSLRREK